MLGVFSHVCHYLSHLSLSQKESQLGERNANLGKMSTKQGGFVACCGHQVELGVNRTMIISIERVNGNTVRMDSSIFKN